MAENNITEIPIEEQQIENPTDQSTETDSSSTKSGEGASTEEDKSSSSKGGKAKKVSAKKKVGTGTAKESVTSPTKEEKHRTECERLAKEYSKHYPTNSEFHITTDGQVFTNDQLSAAQNHQRSRKGGGEVVTIKVK